MSTTIHDQAGSDPDHSTVDPVLMAVVQMNSTSDVEGNWTQARELIVRAAGHGARLVATPENTTFLGPHDRKVALAEPISGLTVARFRELARELGIHLLLGSFPEQAGPIESRRCYNTSLLIGPDGDVRSAYRKIHLFDVDVDYQLRFRESDTTVPGPVVQAAVVATRLGTLGLSICYDLRFAEHYRRLVEAGAEVICVPSAFTMTTGRAHWEPLLRARAIETQCYVLAPAQYGSHDDQGLRESFGHAMIVDPWGQVLARVADGPGLALAEIGLKRLREIRTAMPVADHRRIAE